MGYYIILEKSKYEVIFMNQTCNSTEKKADLFEKAYFPEIYVD